MANNPLETRWGGPSQTHPPIISLSPPNPHSDLLLISEVLQQTFLSLHRHEYHYKALNRGPSTAGVCFMRVEWHGPKIHWKALPAGRTTDITILSFFSPQLLRTTADVDVLAGGGAVGLPRNVAGERTDAYVPWTSSIPRGALEIWSVAKDLLTGGATLSVEARWAMEGEGIVRFRSSVKKIENYFEYGYRVFNQTHSAIGGNISALSALNRTPTFALESGRTRRWVVKSEFVPNEVEGRLEWGVPFADELGESAFPIPLFWPGQDRGAIELTNPMEFQPPSLVGLG